MANEQEHNQQVEKIDEFNGIYLYDIPFKAKHELCQILDAKNIWEELARKMNYEQEDIRNFKAASINSQQSTVEKLLIDWGEYNHDTNELFQLLFLLKQYEAMLVIQEFVDIRMHIMIKVLDNERKMVEQQILASRKILNKSLNSFSNENNVSSDQMGYSVLNANNTGSISHIDYDHLRVATKNWNENHILGKGGFATVFKGMWKQSPMAIKRIESRGGESDKKHKNQIEESLKELRCLNSWRHDNILPVYGYSINGKEPCLVYQLMIGGSLAQRLNDNKTDNRLQWYSRVTIAIGTARGLQYLHTCNEKPLIHGDIKPGNILLDSSLIPKIADFGLAREGSYNDAKAVSKIFGTRPYLPADFLDNRTLSTKVDTYSFGVVLLELSTGLKAVLKNVFLTKYIRNYVDEGNDIFNLMDKMPNSVPEVSKIYENLIQIAQLCTDDKQENRPLMVNVLATLKKEMRDLIPDDLE